VFAPDREGEQVHLADSRAAAVIDPSTCKLFRNRMIAA
jgi:hypothetical protein